MAGSSLPLANRILRGLVWGAIAGCVVLGLGHFWPPLLESSKKIATWALDPLGQVFLRMLFFVVIPLVFASLATGVAQLGRLDRLGPLAGRTFLLFFMNMAIASTIGLILMNVLQPGSFLDPEAKARLLSEYGGAAQKHIAAQASSPSITPMVVVEMFMPKNLFGAVMGHSNAVIGDVLPLILFAILVGAVGTTLPEERRQKLLAGLDMVTELMTGIVHFALRLAPYAVPAMIFSVVIKIGPSILASLGTFLFAVVAGLLFHLFVTMSVWLRFLAKRPVRAFFRDIKSVLVTAFSTSSSNATLPAALDCAQNTLKLQPSVAGFVLPLGTTMNMSGTALYEGCVVLFIAQVFGVHLALGQQITLVLLAVLSAVAVAGIPGGSLPLIAGLLISFGIPPEGIGIILGADRLLDMTRTMVNVGSDIVTTVVVDAQTRNAFAGGAAKDSAGTSGPAKP